jgi:hypothetical protein
LSDAITYLEDALAILRRDEPRLKLIDNYYKGHHPQPYMPDGASAEYRLLAERSVTNWCPLLVQTPAQALYVDNFRRSQQMSIDAEVSPEWKHWQESRLDARQGGVYTTALEFGHSYTVTEKNDEGRPITRGLSVMRTVALYDDPAYDLDPVAAVYIKTWPGKPNPIPLLDGSLRYDKHGLAYVWDDTFRYEIQFDLADINPVILDVTEHGAGECPVTRFTAYLDLEGYAWGVIEPILPLQDRINQTIFDLLMGQTYNSFNVRYVTGMAPPFQMEQKQDGTYGPKLDDEGQPIPDKQYLNASRFFYAEDDKVKFGQLTGGDLSGFIESAELAIRHLSSLTQTPPHFLLGQIANVSAEALEAAETSLSRKVESFRSSFGESWERVFRIALQMLGEAGAYDFLGEVIWRDLGASSLAQSADALGKFAESLDVPKRGLWNRVPGVTRQELNEWGKLREEDDKELALMQKTYGTMQTANGTTQPASGATTRFGSQADSGGVISDAAAAA